MTGHTKAPPPEMQRALSPPPTRPEITSTRFAGHRLYRFTNSESRPKAAMIPMPLPSIHTGIAAGSKAAWSMGNTSMDDIDDLLLQGDGIGDDVDRVRIDHVHHAD